MKSIHAKYFSEPVSKVHLTLFAVFFLILRNWNEFEFQISQYRIDVYSCNLEKGDGDIGLYRM